MKQKIIKILTALIIVLIIVLQNTKVFCSTSSSDYTIQSYNIKMTVNEDNTFDITEKITAYFNKPKHGIYRKIPLKNSITRTDGTTSNNRAKITNISVDKNFKISNENGYKVIKIGDADSTLTGRQTYTIKYKYNIGKDPLKNADELYYNIIGNQWDANIQNITFSITMPKEFDKSTLGFSCGYKGTVNSQDIEYEVNGKTISGGTTRTLRAGEALTIRLTLPEGYFVGASTNISAFTILTILICAVFILIADLLWRKYGKDDAVVETVEFYPPAGLNSAEVGYVYKGTADNESIISLLVYLANDGYLEISETEEEGLFRKSKSFKITKIKNYDGNNEYEKMFFDGLFKCTSIKNISIDKLKEIAEKTKGANQKVTIDEAIAMVNDEGDKKTFVTKTDLYDEFYLTLNKIRATMNSKKNRNKLYEKVASGKVKWILLMVFIIFLLITIKPVYEYAGMEAMFMAVLFPVIGYSVIIGSTLNTSKMQKGISIIWGLLFGGMPWIMTVLPALIDDPMYIVENIVGIISIIVLTMFIKIMPKRTKYGNELYGKIKGFRRFLENAEKQQLEALVEKNPQYFYDILPYTYALGVSKKWMEQFETIALQAPNWYTGYSTFSTYEFCNFMGSTMSSAQSAMSSSPSSSGGGSSGGGSSGGGSGGGGGGSW